MGPNLLLPSDFSFNLSLVVDIFMIVVLFFYNIFAILMTRQVKLLNRSFKTDAAPLLLFFAIVHLFLSLLVLLIAIINLL